jgi:D-alanyl-D-alanine carboxypeptidase
MILSFLHSILIVIISFVFLSPPIVSEKLNLENGERFKGRIFSAVEKVINKYGTPREDNNPFAVLRRGANAKVGLPASPDKPVREKSKLVEYDLKGNCGAVIEADGGKAVFAKEEKKPWPIASITKLMTALVFLDNNPGWENIYEIKKEDKVEGGKINFFTGEKVKIKDLFYSSLVGSENTATLALALSTGLSEENFIKRMNEKAGQLELKQTRFFDTVGLSKDNISTASEVALIAQAAFAKEEIREATLKKKYEFKTKEGRLKTIRNTDGLLEVFPQNGIKILGGKTGYTESAGYCFVGRFTNQDGKEIISVILGAESNDSRFSETKGLVEKVFESGI